MEIGELAASHESFGPAGELADGTDHPLFILLCADHDRLRQVRAQGFATSTGWGYTGLEFRAEIFDGTAQWLDGTWCVSTEGAAWAEEVDQTQ